MLCGLWLRIYRMPVHYCVSDISDKIPSYNLLQVDAEPENPICCVCIVEVWVFLNCSPAIVKM